MGESARPACVAEPDAVRGAMSVVGVRTAVALCRDAATLSSAARSMQSAYHRLPRAESPPRPPLAIRSKIGEWDKDFHFRAESASTPPPSPPRAFAAAPLSIKGPQRPPAEVAPAPSSRIHRQEGGFPNAKVVLEYLILGRPASTGGRTFATSSILAPGKLFRRRRPGEIPPSASPSP